MANNYLSGQRQDQILDDILSPSVIYSPKVFKDGDMFCALYGANLMEGVAGFGKTPREACAEFDRVWNLGDKK